MQQMGKLDHSIGSLSFLLNEKIKVQTFKKIIIIIIIKGSTLNNVNINPNYLGVPEVNAEERACDVKKRVKNNKDE